MRVTRKSGRKGDFGDAERPVHQEPARAAQALVARGWEPGVAKGVMLLIKIAAFGVLLYAAFWTALLLLCIVVVARMAWQHDSDDDTDFLGRKAEERDHREGLFYHPAMHDDDPDPRFKDH